VKSKIIFTLTPFLIAFILFACTGTPEAVTEEAGIISKKTETQTSEPVTTDVEETTAVEDTKPEEVKDKEAATDEATSDTTVAETTVKNNTTETTPEFLGPLTVHFIDVGQGDSILIVTPEGNTVLIDGGSKSSGPNVVSYLKNQGITEINVIMATHPHEDHIGGLISVLDSFEVGNVIDSGVEHTSQTYKNYLSITNSKNINFVNWNLGQQFDIGKAVSFKIIGPVSKSSSDLNNSSIVIKLTYISTSFLFTGDAETESESKILQSSADVEADVLKVGHHGSSSSSTVKFLKAVSPSVAVISCGQENSYGHPHDSTLKNLSSLGITIYRTDTTGTIVIESDGKNINVISGKSFDYMAQVETKSPETSSSETSVSNETNTSLEKQGQYCGSVNSDVFHKPNCSYVDQINPENIVWYETREEAIAKGKRPCKRCGP